MEQDRQVIKRLPQTQVIYFVKHTTGKGYDYPQYNLQGKDFQQLSSYLTQQGAILGLHSSYYPTPLPPYSSTPILIAVLLMIVALPGLTLLAQLNQQIYLPECMAGLEAKLRAMEEAAMAVSALF